MLKPGLKSERGEIKPRNMSLLGLYVSTPEGGSAAESKIASAVLMGCTSSSGAVGENREVGSRVP